jgi:2-desacetyl-2-hydroxyethyl bacteriochlorophyllide A dehydrogenase
MTGPPDSAVTGVTMGGGQEALIVSGPGEVGLRRREPIAAPAGDLLVEPDLVGLCGTDLEIIDGTIDPAYLRYPVVLGHEWTGIVTSAGPLEGCRVVVEGIIGCGHCARCAEGLANLCETYDEIGFTRDGAAASRIAVPARLAHQVSAGVAAADAVLTEPAAVVYRALTRAGVTPGSRVVVIGDGTVALLTVMLAGLWSPAEIAVLGRRAEQADLAFAAGATSFSVTGEPAGYDLAIEAAGASEAVRTALGATRRGGTVLLVGLPPHGQTVPFAADDVVNNDLAVLGSFSYTQAAWRSVVGLINAGMLHPGSLITHRYPLAEWEQAVAALRGAPGPRGKVLLEIRAPERPGR